MKFKILNVSTKRYRTTQMTDWWDSKNEGKQWKKETVEGVKRNHSLLEYRDEMSYRITLHVWDSTVELCFLLSSNVFLTVHLHSFLQRVPTASQSRKPNCQEYPSHLLATVTLFRSWGQLMSDLLMMMYGGEGGGKNEERPTYLSKM